MRREEGSVAHLASAIAEDLLKKQIGLFKLQLLGLADLVATVIFCRSVNTSELAAMLPRDVKCDEHSFKFIYRWLKNRLIDVMKVMKPFVVEIIKTMGSNGQIVVLSFDQTQINDKFQCIMISVRMGGRAVPLLWKVVQTKGPIGFDDQEPLIRALAEMIPSDVRILFAADRFYGTSALISLVQSFGWSYRIRLKNNLILLHEGGELVTGELLKLGLKSVINAQLSNSNVTTNIGVLCEEGYDDPWIIAMECNPSDAKVLDYSMRWCCEPLYSDFKSRGFNISHTQLKSEDRIERMLLILAIATYWCVSTGMDPSLLLSQPSKKKQLEA